MENVLGNKQYMQKVNDFEKSAEIFDTEDNTQLSDIDSAESDSVEHESVEYAND